MITDYDQKIIRYFEEYKYADVDIICKLFYPDRLQAYNIARRRLSELKKHGYIKVYKDMAFNKNIYVYNDKENKLKMPSQHRLIVLKLLASLQSEGYEIREFTVEKSWMNDQIWSDAFVTFTTNMGRKYNFFIEVLTSNNPHNLEKYEKLYEDGEVQKYINAPVFPKIVFISDRNTKIDLKNPNVKVIRLDTKLNQIGNILITDNK